METIHNKIGNSVTRKITETWTHGDYRVKVVTYHDKVKKSYWSIISECRITESSPGFYFERHALHRDLNRLAGSLVVSRFDYYKMDSAHNIAVYSVKELVEQLLASEIASISETVSI